jgi:alanine-glyoxylate transaminase / serine-glyoxylate transaminase / serine-pyruvate transaminase
VRRAAEQSAALFAFVEDAQTLRFSKPASANLSVARGMGIARKLKFPPWQEVSPKENPRAVRSLPAGMSCEKERRANVMTQHVGELHPPVRLMLTPGPSSVDPRVYRALATPLVGHMDPWFKGCMEETQILLRQIFQTENRITMPLSASGSGGIEASVVNVLEEGDEAIIAVNGVFSERMYEIAMRASSKVIKVEAPYGKPVDAEGVRRAGQGRRIKMIGLAHGETSTGVLTRIDAFRKVADELGALLVVDTVASLAAVPLHVDRERVDICFSGSQKAISAPPGMSPITVSVAAEEVFRKRKSKVQSWYFDLTTAMNYWGKDRLYHHTPPISLIFALREAMRLVIEESLEARWERHRVNQLALIAGLEAMGLKLLVEKPADRLPTVTAVTIPSGVNDEKLRNQLLDEFNIEIAGGFGSIKGKIWRVGLMGYCSQKPNVLLFLAALEKCLHDQGFRVPSGAGVGAAIKNYAQVETAAAVSR